jgi:hypothetical protein
VLHHLLPTSLWVWHTSAFDQFADLYNVEDMTTVTSSADARGSTIADNSLRLSGTVLVIKPELHCLGEGKRIHVGGNSGGGQTVPMMLATALADKEDAKGVRRRSLNARTKDSLRNCKKALPVFLRHDTPYKTCAITGMFPSGMSVEDYLLFIRNEMYTELQLSIRNSELGGGGSARSTRRILDEDNNDYAAADGRNGDCDTLHHA